MNDIIKLGVFLNNRIEIRIMSQSLLVINLHPNQKSIAVKLIKEIRIC
jgi:hypothetical protein